MRWALREMLGTAFGKVPERLGRSALRRDRPTSLPRSGRLWRFSRILGKMFTAGLLSLVMTDQGGLVNQLLQPAVSLPTILRVEVIDTWAIWIQACAAAITAIGLVTAGIWALMRFRGGRTFMKRCSIDLDCKVVGVHGKTGIRVNVRVRNCGDSLITFDTTDIAGVEVSSIDVNGWSRLEDSRWVEWQAEGEQEEGEGEDWEKRIWENKDWEMTEDLLMDCGGRFWPVSIEPNQDIVRSCLFMMPSQWAAARVRCIFALGENNRPRWIATRVVTRRSLDGMARFPQMAHILEEWKGKIK